MFGKRIIVVLLLVSCTVRLFSQTPNFYHYTTNDGLPSNECYDIIQDRQGYLWIASDRGVSRYDGYKFKTFTSEDGLTDNTVFNVREDSLGRIWFLTFNGNLCWFKDGKITPYKYNQVLTKLNKGTKIARSFYVDNLGAVTLSYLNHGIVKISSDGSPMLIARDSIPENSFYAFSDSNKFLIGSRIKSNSNESTLPFYTNILKPGRTIFLKTPVGLRNVAGIKRRDGSHAISVVKTLITLQNNNTYQLNISDTEIISLFEDKDSCLWTGLYKGGVLMYQARQTPEITNATKYLSGLSVTSIYQDNENGYWFSTLEEGIYYLPSKSINIINLSSLTHKNTVSGLAINKKGTVYAGTSSGDMFSMQNVYGKGVYHPLKLDSALGTLQTLYYDSLADNTWIGTSKLFGVYQSNKRLKILQRSHTRGISSDQSDTILALAGPSLIKSVNYRLQTVAPIDISFRADVMYTDIDKITWLGCIDGLYFLSGSIFRKASNVPLARVIDLASLPDKRLVLATIGKGIIIKDTGKNIFIGTNESLISNIVNAVHVAGNRIWVGTNRGISCISITGNEYSIRNFDKNHGLPTNEIRKILFRNNRLWLGTNMGLITFNPDEIQPNNAPLQIHLEGIKVNTKESYDSAFAYNENFIEFHYKGISFKQRGEIKYRYRLVGSTNTWIETENTNVQFAALEPGTYKFEVSARNEDGIWNQSPLSYSFVIASPFWKKTGFLVSIPFLVLLISVSWYSFRIRRIKLQNNLILQLEEYQRQALASQINPHFIFNSLNSIHAFILNENRMDASKYLSSFAKLIRKCLEHSSKKYVNVNDEYELLTSYLDLEVMRFKQKFKYEIEIDPNILNSTVQIPSMLLQPYIENSIHHGMIPLTDRQGKINIRLYFIRQQLRCEVEDNGIGREKSQILKETNHESKGTEITEKRMKAYMQNENFEYYFKITDLYNKEQKPSGTLVSFNIPYIKA